MSVGVYFPRSYLPYMLHPAFRPPAAAQNGKAEKKSTNTENVFYQDDYRQSRANLAIHRNDLFNGEGGALDHGSRLERLSSIKRNDRPAALTMSEHNAPPNYANDDNSVENHYQDHRLHHKQKTNHHYKYSKNPEVANLVKAFFSPTLHRKTRNEATFPSNMQNAKKSVNGFQRTGGMILLGKRRGDGVTVTNDRPLAEYSNDEI